MGAGLDDAAMIKHDDTIGMDEGRQAVRYHEGGGLASAGFEGIKNDGLGFCVDGAHGIVEDEDRGLFEHRAGNGYALALAAGKGDAAFADDGFVSFFKGENGLMNAGGAGGIFNFVIRGRTMSQS